MWHFSRAEGAIRLLGRSADPPRPHVKTRTAMFVSNGHSPVTTKGTAHQPKVGLIAPWISVLPGWNIFIVRQ